MTRGSSAPGHPVSVEELRAEGFTPLELRITRTDVALTSGVGCEWTTLGDVPDSAGLYAFTVSDGSALHVVYVGLTTHLWMVTKGHLPRSGGARGGQRYGRPTHAGVTRKRINVLLAAELAAGRHIQHWVRPLAAEVIEAEEERLIQQWQLRRVGWNRG